MENGQAGWCCIELDPGTKSSTIEEFQSRVDAVRIVEVKYREQREGTDVTKWSELVEVKFEKPVTIKTTDVTSIR